MSMNRVLVAAFALSVMACSSSNSDGGGSGGKSSQGGASGGTTNTGGKGSGGQVGSGGNISTGGAASTGGLPGTGGLSGTGGGSGGRTGSGGARADGGTIAVGQGGSGGRNATGGSFAGGGISATGGFGAGGIVATGGSSGLDGSVDSGTSSLTGPCDIFATGNAPCVAAHSTVRLLASTYSGPLYQVRRASDSKTQDISFQAQSGAADSAAQETFCTGTKCTISVVYDQSGKGNHLKRSQGGAEVCKHLDLEAVADALPLTIGGHKVYGIKVVSDDSGPCTPPSGSEGTGYRLDKTTGIATGDDAETEYMVTSGDTQALRQQWLLLRLWQRGNR
jgi:hypothetical protein